MPRFLLQPLPTGSPHKEHARLVDVTYWVSPRLQRRLKKKTIFFDKQGFEGIEPFLPSNHSKPHHPR